jgi:hypothetical protein
VSDPRDDELSGIYRDADAGGPPQRLDDAILAASRRAVGSRPQPLRSRWSRWSPPIALAATVLITASITLLVVEEQPSFDTRELSAPPGPPAQGPAAPAAEAPKKAIPKDLSRQRENDRAPVEPRFAPDPPPAAPQPKAVEQAREAPAAASAPPSVRSEMPAERRMDESVRAAPAAPAELGAARDAPNVSPAPPAPARAPMARPQAAAKPAPDIGVRGTGALESAVRQRPEDWIELIRRLKAEGRTVEAERELKEFRSRYPEYRLPEDLRQP